MLEQFLAESSQVNTFTALSLHGKDHDLSIHFQPGSVTRGCYERSRFRRWLSAFFSLLRLIESQAPHAAALGESGPASAEAVRLRPSLELSFPDQRSRRGRTPAKCRRSAPCSVVTANISGLYGVGSPLPRSYPHQVLLQADTDPQQRDFLDIIHHRVLSLWYRSFRRQHYEQSFAEDGTDLLSQALLD